MLSETVEAGNSSTSLDQRKIFLEQEKNISSNLLDAFPKAAEAIRDYPLFPILEYIWLSKHLDRSSQVQQFIEDNRYNRYSGILKNQWLSYLADTEQWHRFIQHYEKSNNRSLECKFYWAKYHVGEVHAALKAAAKIWSVGYSQPKACDKLFSALQGSQYFTNKVIWKRFISALKNRQERLAIYVKKLMPKQKQITADFWLKVHKSPILVFTDQVTFNKMPRRGEIFAYAIDRLASSDLERAIQEWDQKNTAYKMPKKERNRINKRLGLALAYQKNPKAYQYLERVVNPDKSVQEWLIRSALLAENWEHVGQAFTKLDKELLQQPRWQYWWAKHLAKTQENAKSSVVFHKLAEDRSLFGFLAASEINIPPQLGDHPILLNSDEFSKFKKLPAIQMVSELKSIDRLNLARKQWWYNLNNLSNEQKLLAAKLAEQWGWTQTAIFTVAKAGHWDDVNLRFPIEFESDVKKFAGQFELDPAIVFGLIRRESVFDQNARSPVGARGLMQIMPQTGRQIARKLKEKWRSASSLFNPETNLKYGTYYFKQMLDRFNGHFALAAAAYNAGPARVQRWMPKTLPMQADIWIETIPFTETREYVTAVLSYAIIYQQRLKREVLKIKNLLKDVMPSIN